jgi:hypothetical protein
MKFLGLAAAALALALAAPASAQQTMVITTNPQGTSFYASGAAIAKLMSDQGMPAIVRPTAGASSNVPSLDKGEIDFAILHTIDTGPAYEATGDYKDRTPAKNLRVVTVVFQVLFGIMVANDSPAKALKDIKGLRMPTEYTAQSAILPNVQAMLATAGLSLSDMKPYPVPNYVQGIRAFGEGKVDVTAVTPGIGPSREAAANLASHGGVRMLPLPNTPQAEAAMKKLMPPMKFISLRPDPSMPEVKEPLTATATSVYLVTHKGMPDEVVYKTVKAIRERKDDYVAGAPTIRTFDPDHMAEANAAPYHPGAEKYFKEIGQWPPKAQ